MMGTIMDFDLDGIRQKTFAVDGIHQLSEPVIC